VADGPSRPASDVLRELSEGLVYRRTLTIVDPLEER